MELIFSQKLTKKAVIPHFTLSLTAEERTRSRYRWETPNQIFFFKLARGTVMQSGDLLQAESGEILEILAKPEPVYTITAENLLELLRVAYHLGNRHVSLEIHPTYLRLSPDPVLKTMLGGFAVSLKEEIVPFQPEIGAYHHH